MKRVRQLREMVIAAAAAGAKNSSSSFRLFQLLLNTAQFEYKVRKNADTGTDRQKTFSGLFQYTVYTYLGPNNVQRPLDEPGAKVVGASEFLRRADGRLGRRVRIRAAEAEQGPEELQVGVLVQGERSAN